METDKQLVRAAQAGSKPAFDFLVIRYQSRVLAIIAGIVRNRDEVPDLAQEAFIKAYRALGSFRQDSSFYTWLYRIAVNTGKNHVASAIRREQVIADNSGAAAGGPGSDRDDGDYMQQERASDAVGVSAGATSVSPEQLLAGEQLGNVLNAAIAAMPEDMRTALSLREYEGLSYEDISVVLDCPVGTVRSRIFRARAQLDSTINAYNRATQGDQRHDKT